MVTIGYEYEVAGGGTGVLAELHRSGHVGDDHLHPYHCQSNGCHVCQYDNYGPDGTWLFSPQSDPTVSAEFPSKILTWGTDQCEDAFLAMERAAVLSGCSLDGNSGMHVHVAKTAGIRGPRDGLFYTPRQMATWNLLRIFVRYQDTLDEYAQASRPSVRGYNSRVVVRPEHEDVFWNTRYDEPRERIEVWGSTSEVRDGTILANGSWFSSGHDATWEFRLWNAAKAAWRQRLAVGLSVAMVKAAEDDTRVTQHDARSFEDVVGPYCDDTTWAGILRQRFSKGGISND